MSDKSMGFIVKLTNTNSYYKGDVSETVKSPMFSVSFDNAKTMTMRQVQNLQKQIKEPFEVHEVFTRKASLDGKTAHEKSNEKISKIADAQDKKEGKIRSTKQAATKKTEKKTARVAAAPKRRPAIKPTKKTTTIKNRKRK